MRPVAGADSLQALILALEFATEVLPHEVASTGGRIQWLGESERVIFARQGLAHAADEVIVALLGRLKRVAAVLDSGDRDSGTHRRRAMIALSAIGSSVGHAPAPSLRSRRGKKRR